MKMKFCSTVPEFIRIKYCKCDMLKNTVRKYVNKKGLEPLVQEIRTTLGKLVKVSGSLFLGRAIIAQCKVNRSDCSRLRKPKRSPYQTNDHQFL